MFSHILHTHTHIYIYSYIYMGQCITIFKFIYIYTYINIYIYIYIYTLIHLCSSRWPETGHWTWGMLEMRILSKSARWKRIFGSAQVQPLPKLCIVSRLWRRRGWVLGFQWRWGTCTSILASESDYSTCLLSAVLVTLCDYVHYLNGASCEIFFTLMWDHCCGSG